MQLLATLSVKRPEGKSEIRLYRGDLAAIPAEEAVDLLVVSAFPNNYEPTPTSVIGALHRRGLSVAELAARKRDDLRETFGCWLSQPLSPELAERFAFKRLLCFEPLMRGSPPEVVGEIFRCLMPFAWAEPPIRSIALPLVASGNAQLPASVIFEPLIQAAVQWLQRGLPIEVLKIVEYNEAKAEDLRQRFERLRARIQPAEPERSRAKTYDVFMSYSREDRDAVERLLEALRQGSPDMRIFLDQLELKPGVSWQDEIDRAILGSAKIVALYSPAYLASKVCQEEFALARAQHRKRGDVLHPIYLRSTELLAYMEIIDFDDCREADHARLEAAAKRLVEWYTERASAEGAGPAKA